MPRRLGYLLPCCQGRVVRLVGVGRETLDSGIYRYPKENTKNQINHETQGAMLNHMMTCPVDAKISLYKLLSKIKCRAK